MSQSELAKKTGIRASTINEWYHEIVARLNVDHIDKICEVLNCSSEELIEYIPNKKKRTGTNLIFEEHGNQKKSPDKDQK